MLVLCVDDDRLVRDVTGNMLRELGHEVIEAGDADTALDTLARCGRKVDILMTDIRMPGMNGFTLARRARSEHPDMRVIYMTGYVDGPVPPGVHIHKPCTLRRLDKVMKDALHY